jgi:hypothetical protein
MSGLIREEPAKAKEKKKKKTSDRKTEIKREEPASAEEMKIGDLVDWKEFDERMFGMSEGKGVDMGLLKKWPMWRYYTDTKGEGLVIRVVSSSASNNIQCLVLKEKTVSQNTYTSKDIKTIDTWTEIQNELIREHPIPLMWIQPFGHYNAIRTGAVYALRHTK